ncbi:eukaryotic aspartyl protease (macronuclear) [Tetrahymena thermophila SB210]|uniref:Eukaryotic aspartyl protease n=1 Tax=Tetrahymena thermophila (strain SB210) TaxID=312017 RepID=Q237C7_TETTS|nr:eukaryotic aspartyl protease [Tetrahymena thermophila SB210]EAR92323.1 eukaryotic aspartyl protease [Tetrahymena thermophila SB210]|eukprot:XP_001012568.1 eukaryotic aspartyl protease [Tetrahymena thermophila SB210]
MNQKLLFILIALASIFFNQVACSEKVEIDLVHTLRQKFDIKSVTSGEFQKIRNQKIQQIIQKFEKQNKAQINKLNLASTPQEIEENIHRSYSTFKEIVTLTNFINFQYIGQIKVGSSNQQFTVLFDTGSNQLWLPQDQCQQCTFANSRYTCQTNTCSNTTQDIAYGQGKVKGYNSKDLITVGNKSTFYPFLSVFQAQDLDGFQSDGIMGMGVSKKDSLVNKLYMEKKIEKNQFSFKLSSIDLSQYSKDQQNMATDKNSQLILGGYDDQLISEDSINYFQVVSKSYWAIKMRSARYNKQDIFNGKNELRLALIDTGTSLIHMPTADYQAFNRTVLEKSSNKGCFEFGLLICVCNQKQIPNFPTISLTFTDVDNNDQIINILPEYYIMYQDGFCVYLVAEFPDMGINNMWILGDVFMRQTYNIFDYDRQAIGIVNLQPEDEEGHQIKSGTFSGFGKLVIMLLVIGIGAFLANYIYQNYIKNNSNNQQQNYQGNYQQYQPQQSYQPPQQYYQQQPPQQYYQQPPAQYNNQNYQNIPLQPLNQQQV